MFKFLFAPKYTGTVEDTRPESEKAKDWLVEELYSFTAAGYPFRETTSVDWKAYTPRNQANSGSCVANTVAKILEVKRFMGKNDYVKFSHAPIYINRSNKPATGMIGADALKLAIKYSSCKETDLPSENKSDAELDAIKLPIDYENLNNLVTPTNSAISQLIDFDIAANLVNKEGAVMLWVNSSWNNWCRDIPTPGGKNGGIRHSVTIVDAVHYNGIEYLVIEDSFGSWSNGWLETRRQRLLTREFFKDAAYFMAVLTEFKYDVVDKVKFKEFNTVLNFGDKFEEVKRLQDFLKTQGVFPSNVDSTGYYGNVTAKAVYAFQIKHSVDTLTVLDQLKGKRVGTKTLAVINKLLSKGVASS